MFLTIINDCRDENAFGRQVTRASILFNTSVATIGVDFGKSLEGAGNLIDVLDASEGAPGVILVNFAPRHRGSKKWENGTPFCYFYYKETLVVSTVDDDTLSLVKKFEIASSVKLLDLPSVIDKAVELNLLDSETGERIKVSQFRSFDFSPRVARWIWDKVDLPFEDYSMDNVTNAPRAVWHVDNFGNCKTTVFADEVDFVPGKPLDTKFGDIKCFEYLKDVPRGELAIIKGSSGLGSKKFLEVVVQGGSAAKEFDLHPGAEIF